VMSRMCYSSKRCVHPQVVTHSNVTNSVRVSRWLKTEAGTGCNGGHKYLADYLKDL